MEHPNIKTKVQHSKSKQAFNVVSTELGKKYKIARIPYVVVKGDEITSTNEKSEALRIANFISYCMNNKDKVIL